MKGIWAEAPGQLKKSESIPKPVLKGSGVIIKVLKASVQTTTKQAFGPEFPLKSLIPYPLVPGTTAVGIVEQIGGEVSSDLKVGDLVVYAPHIGNAQDGFLSGLFHYGSEKSTKLAKIWRDGAYAELLQIPAANVVPVRGSIAKSLGPSKLTVLNYLGISYGGLLNSGIQPGQSIAIGGAGHIGVGCVLLALAMGVSQVYVYARNKDILQQLEKIDKRVIGVLQEDDDLEKFGKKVKALPRVNAYIDTYGRVNTPQLTVIGIESVATKGTVVFVGGVFTAIPINYFHLLTTEISIKGSYMYPVDRVVDILNFIEAGLLNLNLFDIVEYPLDKWEQAFDDAGQLKGFKRVIISFD